MVRPSDLPQPVKHHGSHDGTFRSNGVPGPGAYGGNGITDHEKSKILGFVGRATRFPKGQLSPSDLTTTVTRDNFLDTPGAIYNPTERATRIPQTFSTAKRMAEDHRRGELGPGHYKPRAADTVSVAVSFTKGLRPPPHRRQEGPSPAVYTPTLQPTGHGSAFFTSQARIRESRETDDCPPLSALDAMDASLAVTKRKIGEPCSFSRAARFDGAHKPSSDNGRKALGPGEYNVARANSVTRRATPSAGFGSGKQRVSPAAAATQAPHYKLRSCDHLSGHSRAPSAGFSKAARRALPNAYDTSLPGHLYTPAHTATETARPAGRFGTAQRMQASAAEKAHAAASGPPTANETAEAKNEWVQDPAKAVGFTKGLRPPLHNISTRGMPGPDVYLPLRPRRPDSAAQSFTKADRSKSAAAEQLRAEAMSPGAKYDPDFSLVEKPLALQASFSRAARATAVKARTPTAKEVGGGGTYQVSYAVIDKRPRSAVLYLGS
jgi:hypothetical protein